MEQAARAAAGTAEQEQHQEQRGVTVDKEAKQSRETGGRRDGGTCGVGEGYDCRREMGKCRSIFFLLLNE